MDRSFRFENKYTCSEHQFEILKNRVKNLMFLDPNCSQQGYYNIRSLYFDTEFNDFYYENEDGTDKREKYRIRIYNNSPEHISLEIKRKEHGMTQKRACPISKEQFNSIVNGELLPIGGENPAVLNKFLLNVMTRNLKPAVIVDYNRIPFIYPDGNVRVTFDSDIRSSTDITHFFEPDISNRPIMPQGTQLLEVKYDNFIPDFIYSSLQLGTLRQTTFSKYYLCRKYSLSGRNFS